jgi:hypothetical protein
MKRITQMIYLACHRSNATSVKKQTTLLAKIALGWLALSALALAQTWTSTTPTPTLGSQAFSKRFANGAATGPDGKAYIVGGYAGYLPPFTPPYKLTGNVLVEQYDPISNTVTDVAQMNTPRGFQATVTGCDGKIYAIGGVADNSLNHNGPQNSVEAYDTALKTWTTLDVTTNTSGGFLATVGNDCNIYVFGTGADWSGNSGDVEMLAGTWSSGQWNYNCPWVTQTSSPGPVYAAVTDYSGNIYGLDFYDLFEYSTTTQGWTDCQYGPCSSNGGPNFASAIDRSNLASDPYAATLGGDGNIYLADFGNLYSDYLPGLPRTGWLGGTPIETPATNSSPAQKLPHWENFAMTTAEGQMLVVGGDRENSGPSVDSYGPMPANLLPYQDFWKFDNSGYDFASPSCAASGTASFTSSGRVVGALSLNGETNLSLALPACGDIGAGDFSIEFWIKPTSSESGVVSILDKREFYGAYVGYQVFLYNNKVGLQMDNGRGYQNYGSDIALTPNQWTHIAITVARQSNPRNELNGGIIWVNGVMAARFTPMQGSLGSPSDLNIGGDNFGGSHYSGLLDELAIYKRALTFAEVRSVFLAGEAGKFFPTARGI